MQLFYREMGQGTPLIILHGVFGSSDNWLSIGKRFAENGFHTYLIDQRNHGQSPHVPIHDYSSMAVDLLSFLDEKRIDKAIIIGHSMGGKTAMQFAVTNADRILKMIIVDIAPKQYLIHHGKILRGLNTIPLELLKSRQEADEILSEYEPDKGTKQFLLKNLYRKEDNSFAWRMNLPVLTAQIGNVVAPLRWEKPIQVDTLFMKGAKSWYVTTEDEATIRQIFPQSRFCTIADAGHWIQAEQPEAFLQATLDFLRQ